MLARKPRVGDRIGFGEFTTQGVVEALKPRFTVTRVGQSGSSDNNLCWIREDGLSEDPKNSLPFIWQFKEGLNQLAKIFEDGPARDGIDRSKYVYEGPNGTPRSKKDYSPDTRLTHNLGDKFK